MKIGTKDRMVSTSLDALIKRDFLACDDGEVFEPHSALLFSRTFMLLMELQLSPQMTAVVENGC